MKAAYLTGHGGNEVVFVGERPTPVRKPGEVLIRLKAATLNQVDLYMRNSGAGITHELPLVMGVDGSGVIEELDAAEHLLQVGQEVVLHPGLSCGRCEFCLRGDDVLCQSFKMIGEHRDGTFAEYISVPSKNVFLKPQHLNAAEAAALGVNFLTAWRMLFTQAQLRPSEVVLIFGIGGGVSMAALQLAKSTGARVIATSRDPEKLKVAKSLGADEVICSTELDVSKTVMKLTGGRGVDVVIENVGEAVWSAALKSLVRGGRLIVCGATSGDNPSADLKRVFIRQLKIFGSTLGSLYEFRELLAFCQQTGLRPYIDKAYAMDELHTALQRLESGEQVGKLALNIN